MLRASSDSPACGRHGPLAAAAHAKSSVHTQTIDRCRELLGDAGQHLSDEEIGELQRQAETMAHILIAMFVASAQGTASDD